MKRKTSHELFKADISKLNVFELIDWICSCRTEIKRQDFDTEQDYRKALLSFCCEWESHHEKYKAFYESEAYSRAIVYTSLKGRTEFFTDFGNGKIFSEIDSYEDLRRLTFLREETILELSRQYSIFYDKLDEIFIPETYDSYKTHLREYIVKYRFSKVEFKREGRLYNFRTLKTPTYEQFIRSFEKENCSMTIKRSFKRLNSTAELENFGVIRSFYNKFNSYKYCEKHFDKGMLVNLAFAMSMPYNHLERLLSYNGYSVSEVSHREFDRIIRTAFKCGFSRDMTIALINIENEKGLNIPNLAKHQKK